MKQNLARTLSIVLALMSFVGAAQLFADENTINLESVIIQNFDNPDAQPWFVMGSKFATVGFPRMTYVKASPQAAMNVSGTDTKDLRALGIAMLYDRQEYNWVDIIPGIKGGDASKPTYTPTELPLPGRVKAIDLWVWSGNYDYYLEAYVRDYTGIVHTVQMGNLNFVGWKNLRFNVPDSVPQSRKYLPKREALTLVKFRIWTRPTEKVVIPIRGEDPDKEDPDYESKMEARNIDRAVKFYFDNLKVLTDTFESLYDGDQLTQPGVVKDAWGSGGKK